MNKLVLKATHSDTGLPSIVQFEEVVCEKHLGQPLAITGQSNDPCVHCSVEWHADWKRLLANNEWLGKLGKTDLVYIAGPMTGIEDFNRPAFWMMEHAIKLREAQVMSPAHYENLSLPYEWYMRNDIAMLLKCNVVVFLCGWKKSKGAKVEHRVATIIGSTIYYQI